MFNRSRIVLGLAAALSVGLAASQLKAGFGFEEPACTGFIKGTVSFSTGGTGGVKIHVYDTDGNLVAELESNNSGEFLVELVPGTYKVVGIDTRGGSTSEVAVIPECDKIAEVSIVVAECH